MNCNKKTKLLIADDQKGIIPGKTSGNDGEVIKGQRVPKRIEVIQKDPKEKPPVKKKSS